MATPDKQEQKESQKMPAPPVATPADIADAGSMDKIRDILFGNQAKDYENRFSNMEEQFQNESRELKQELLKRMDALETYTKQEISDINERIRNEAQDREAAVQKLEKLITQEFDALNKRLHKDEENLAKKSSELREQILAQSKTLTEEIAASTEKTASQLKQTAQSLDTAKVNRSDLSGFFLDIAMRLSGDDPSAK